MRQIQLGMAESMEKLGMKGGNRSAYWHTSKRLGRHMDDALTKKDDSLLKKDRGQLEFGGGEYEKADRMQVSILPKQKTDFQKNTNILPEVPDRGSALTMWNKAETNRGFVPAGQSTQMIIGATGESDFEIISVSEALYKKFDLKRVFYSAFINVNNDSTLPALEKDPPLRREHRLYQADWLLRYYGFEANELLSEKRPFFNTYLDPKCDWALGHLEDFPVEINTADYDTLLRVPGIGVKSAGRIVRARKTGQLDFDTLKKIGVVLKRAVFFITCSGKMMYNFLKVDEDYITRNLVANEGDIMKGFGQDITYKQLTLFDDFSLG